jgi:uncharacterized protein YkwD
MIRLSWTIGAFVVLGCQDDAEPTAMGTEGTTSATDDGTTAGSPTTASNPRPGPGSAADTSTGDDADPTSTSGPSSADASDTTTGVADSTGAAPESDCSAEELELIDLVNAYRGENGLPAIPASPSLCIVGHTHTEDLAMNAPHAEPGCNLHSWSDAGPWSACCYTDDHAQAECMWDKPAELTSYPGNGYENAAGGGGELTPQQALDLWKASPGHNAVILEQGPWADHPWGALGAGMYEGYAVLWFGDETDPRS